MTPITGPLASEHWERPGILRSLLELGSYRRRQNLHRCQSGAKGSIGAKAQGYPIVAYD